MHVVYSIVVYNVKTTRQKLASRNVHCNTDFCCQQKITLTVFNPPFQFVAMYVIHHNSRHQVKVFQIFCSQFLLTFQSMDNSESSSEDDVNSIQYGSVGRTSTRVGSITPNYVADLLNKTPDESMDSIHQSAIFTATALTSSGEHSATISFVTKNKQPASSTGNAVSGE